MDNEDYRYYEFPADECEDLPANCAILCDGDDNCYSKDNCGNKLIVMCSDSAGGWGHPFCAYQYFYEPNGGDLDHISACVLLSGDNGWYYKKASICGTSQRVFTKAKHENYKTKKWLQLDGCYGYYCVKFQTYNCLTMEKEV
ncbi:MAG: hypothetical protein WCZ89_10035 [Phycisphaerae bacterium]